MDYKSTLNLPQTDFPMRAGLPDREPKQVEAWLKDRVYHRMIEKAQAAKAPRFLLHDGPPYANGNIHIGHALNKVLKDVVVKYKSMSGFEAQYIPGWDCHGLPIELGVEKQLIEAKRDKATVPITELRQMCRDYASKYIEIQKLQFQRLEVFGDWDKRYATMDQEYVASIVRELGRCAKAGVLYQGNKPVYWCTSCATALAEAEIEYADKKSPSIYVKFELRPEALQAFPELEAAKKKSGAERVSVVIWTTTPWTLPSNLAIALHPEFDYVAIEVPSVEGTQLYIVAQGLQEAFEKAVGAAAPFKTALTFKAERLHRQNARHPFIERDSLLILGDHVTLEAGTGAVHTAPGHGVDDYKIGTKYGLEIYAPVDAKGKYTAQFAEMQNQFVFKANEPIIEMLRARGALVHREDLVHSYPHCWRCNSPIIFRATPQWFIGMESPSRKMRQEALALIQQVEWIPSWGINRIVGMIESRPDWCISRQRIWGTPITAFYCESCDAPKADEATFFHVADLIQKNGTDVWFTAPADKLLPPGAQCASCSGTTFRKERDILDVWFESGVSHAAVCEERELGWPADLYLEGSDQHRGWFQTSLLTAVATRRRAPFKTVLTHGFVNDKDGKKMSKSKGNVASPLDIMKTLGADILRLWVVLEDYRNDVSFSQESLERVSETYRKIRNTIRFLLGNLHDFDPDRDLVDRVKLADLDRWALSRAAEVFEKIRLSYDNYEFHQVYHLTVNYCAVDLSAIYFDILKDRLYTAKKDSLERRSSQTALWLIGNSLIRALAPILSFTSEECWSFLPRRKADPASVLLMAYPTKEHGLSAWRDEKLDQSFAAVWTAREVVTKALEEARNTKLIGHAREARVVLKLSPEPREALAKIAEDPKRVFLVSELEIVPAAETSAEVSRASGTKCARCWTHSKEVGQSKAHPELCQRCEEAVS